MRWKCWTCFPHPTCVPIAPSRLNPRCGSSILATTIADHDIDCPMTELHRPLVVPPCSDSGQFSLVNPEPAQYRVQCGTNQSFQVLDLPAGTTDLTPYKNCSLYDHDGRLITAYRNYFQSPTFDAQNPTYHSHSDPWFSTQSPLFMFFVGASILSIVSCCTLSISCCLICYHFSHHHTPPSPTSRLPAATPSSYALLRRTVPTAPPLPPIPPTQGTIGEILYTTSQI